MITTKSLSILVFFGFLFFSLQSCQEKPPVEYPKSDQRKMLIDGIERFYLVTLPSKYGSSNEKLPLVIGLHGTAGSGLQFDRDNLFSVKAEDAGFIAVYPDGVRGDGPLQLRSWNAGSCCDYAAREKIDDVKFIRTLIDHMLADYRVDSSRVYVTGMSNGAMLAYRLAAEIPDKVAAIAPVSGSMVSVPPAEQKRAVPILHLHSQPNRIVPVNGGTNAAGYHFPPADSTLKIWAVRNRLKNNPETTQTESYTVKKWYNPTGSLVIEFYLTSDGGHAWPGGKQVRPGAHTPSTAIHGNTLIWDFFRRYSLP